MGRSRFVWLGSWIKVNPDLVESISVTTVGGRETVVVQMMSGNRITLPSSWSIKKTEEALNG